MDPNAQESQQEENQQPPQQHIAQSPQTTSSFSKIVFTIIVIIIVLGLIGGAYYLGTQKNMAAHSQKQALIAPTAEVTTEMPTITTAPTSDDVANWKIFTNPLGYSLVYPSDWVLNPKYIDPNGGLGTETISLTDPQGDKLLFDYGYRPLGVPPHVFKTQNSMIDGLPMIKAYNDGCDFNADGITAAAAPCKSVATQFYQITYASPDGLSNDPTVVDSTPGTKDYAWTTGSQSVSLGIANLHGRPSYLAFILQNRLAVSDSTFQATDSLLDKIIASIKFTK